MKSDGIERRPAAQLRTAETAIVKNDDRRAICIEQGETGLDRIRAEPLDLDNGFDDRSSLAESSHGAEMNGNIGSTGFVAGELIEQCDETVKRRVDRHGVEIIAAERMRWRSGRLQIHFDHMMTEGHGFGQKLEMRAIMQSETFRRFVSHIGGQRRFALIARSFEGLVVPLARQRLAATPNHVNRPFVMA